MSSACLICENPYDKNDCTPLILPCGHITCRKCLLKLEGKCKICIVCEKSWAGSSVGSFAICFHLIPGEITKIVRTFWCNTCLSTSCIKNTAKENGKCDLILLDEKCLQLIVDYTDLCKNISIKKSNLEKFRDEITLLCGALNVEICHLSDIENLHKASSAIKDHSIEETLVILSDNIKLCKESLATKLPVTTSPLLSPIMSALQVNCSLIIINFQSLLHHCCLP